MQPDKLLTFTLVTLLLIAPSFSQFYADVVIDVAESGVVSITGLSNHPSLNASRTEEYTSKNKSYWLLNITLPQVFEDYYYEVVLPRGAVINYIRTPSNVEIGELDNRIRVKSFAQNQYFYLVIQYSIQPVDNTTLFYTVLILAGAGAGILIYLRYNGRTSRVKIDHSLLTERQSLIVKHLENSGRASQKELEDALKLPKASLSRNIDSLERKGIVKKHSKGVTNIIVLEEKKQP
jgi:uncharacterized membrane protein